MTRLLLQPASGKEATEHYHDTMETHRDGRRKHHQTDATKDI